MQQSYRQRFRVSSNENRFAPEAKVALGGDGAAHRVQHNDMPPLAGLLLSAIESAAILSKSLTAVSAAFLPWSGR